MRPTQFNQYLLQMNNRWTDLKNKKTLMHAMQARTRFGSDQSWTGDWRCSAVWKFEAAVSLSSFSSKSIGFPPIRFLIMKWTCWSYILVIVKSKEIVIKKTRKQLSERKEAMKSKFVGPNEESIGALHACIPGCTSAGRAQVRDCLSSSTPCSKSSVGYVGGWVWGQEKAINKTRASFADLTEVHSKDHTVTLIKLKRL